MVLEIVYIVLMILWAVFSLPSAPVVPNGPRYGVWLEFVLFVILGLVLFGGQLIR